MDVRQHFFSNISVALVAFLVLAACSNSSDSPIIGGQETVILPDVPPPPATTGATETCSGDCTTSRSNTDIVVTQTSALTTVEITTDDNILTFNEGADKPTTQVTCEGVTGTVDICSEGEGNHLVINEGALEDETITVAGFDVVKIVGEEIAFTNSDLGTVIIEAGDESGEITLSGASKVKYVQITEDSTGVATISLTDNTAVITFEGGDENDCDLKKQGRQIFCGPASTARGSGFVTGTRGVTAAVTDGTHTDIAVIASGVKLGGTEAKYAIDDIGDLTATILFSGIDYLELAGFTDLGAIELGLSGTFGNFGAVRGLTLTGTSSLTSITGSSGADVIRLVNGTITLEYIDGGAGDDMIVLGQDSGGTGRTTAINFTGTAPTACDTLTGGMFRICGGAGNDTLVIDTLVTFTFPSPEVVTTAIGSFETCTDSRATPLTEAQCVGVSVVEPPEPPTEPEPPVDESKLTGDANANTLTYDGTTHDAIDALGGNDTINVTGTGELKYLKAGAGDDTVRIGVDASNAPVATAITIPAGTSSDDCTATAPAGSRICGGGGDDTIHLTSTALGTIGSGTNAIREFETMHLYNFATRLGNMTLGGGGLMRDVVNLTLNDSDFNGIAGTAAANIITINFTAGSVGAGNITARGGNDTITISNSGSGTPFVGPIAGDSGNDIISVTNIRTSRITGGDNNDTITLSGRVTASLTTSFQGNGGNDTIILSDNADISLSAINGLSGGAGDDWLKVGSNVDIKGGTRGFAVFNATSSTAAGDTSGFTKLTLTGASIGTSASPAIIRFGTGPGMFANSSGNAIRFLELLDSTFYGSITGTGQTDKIYIAGGTAINLQFIDGGAGDDTIALGQDSDGDSFATRITFIGTAPDTCDTLTGGKYRICGGAGNDTLIIDTLVTYGAFPTDEVLTTAIGGFNPCPNATGLTDAECAGESVLPQGENLGSVQDNMTYGVITGMTTADTDTLTNVTASDVNLGGGNDAVTFSGGAYSGTISGDADNDTITLDGAITISAIDGGAGTDHLNINTGTVITRNSATTTTLMPAFVSNFERFSAPDYTLSGYSVLTLEGGASTLATITGTANADTYNILSDLTLTESLSLGEGNDTLRLGVNAAGTSSAVALDITATASECAAGVHICGGGPGGVGTGDKIEIGSTLTYSGALTVTEFELTTIHGGEHSFHNSSLGQVTLMGATILNLSGTGMSFEYIQGSDGDDTINIAGGTIINSLLTETIRCGVAGPIDLVRFCGGAGNDTLNIMGTLTIRFSGAPYTNLTQLTGELETCTSMDTTLIGGAVDANGSCVALLASDLTGTTGDDSLDYTAGTHTNIDAGRGDDIVTITGTGELKFVKAGLGDDTVFLGIDNTGAAAATTITAPTSSAGCTSGRICGDAGTDKLVVNGAASIFGSTYFNPAGNNQVSGFEKIEYRYFRNTPLANTVTYDASNYPEIKEIAFISGRDVNGTTYTNRRDIDLSIGPGSINSGSATNDYDAYLIGVRFGGTAMGNGDNFVMLAGNSYFSQSGIGAGMGGGDDTLLLGGSYDDYYGDAPAAQRVDGGTGPAIATKLGFPAGTTGIHGGGGTDMVIFDGDPQFSFTDDADDGTTGYASANYSNINVSGFEKVIIRNRGAYTGGITLGSGSLLGGVRTLSLENTILSGALVGTGGGDTIYLSGTVGMTHVSLGGGINNLYIGDRLNNDGTTKAITTALAFSGTTGCGTDANIRICGGNGFDTLTIGANVTFTRNLVAITDGTTLFDNSDNAVSPDLVPSDGIGTAGSDTIAVHDRNGGIVSLIDAGAGHDFIYHTGSGYISYINAGPDTADDGDDIVHYGVNENGENVATTTAGANPGSCRPGDFFCGGAGTDRLVINGAAHIYPDTTQGGNTAYGTNYNFFVQHPVINSFEMIELRNWSQTNATLNMSLFPNFEELALISGRTRSGTAGSYTYANNQEVDLGDTGSITVAGDDTAAQRVHLVGVNLGSIVTGGGADKVLIAGQTDINSADVYDTRGPDNMADTADDLDPPGEFVRAAVDVGAGNDILILGGGYEDVYGAESILHLDLLEGDTYSARPAGAGADTAALTTAISLAGSTTTINGGDGTADVLVFDGDPQFDLAGGTTYIDPDFSSFPASGFETLIIRGGDYSGGIDLSGSGSLLSTITALSLEGAVFSGGIVGSTADETFYLSGMVGITHINLGDGADTLYIGDALNFDGTRKTTATTLTFSGDAPSTCDTFTGGRFRICGGGGDDTLIIDSTVNFAFPDDSDETIATAAGSFSTCTDTGTATFLTAEQCVEPPSPALTGTAAGETLDYIGDTHTTIDALGGNDIINVTGTGDLKYLKAGAGDDTVYIGVDSSGNAVTTSITIPAGDNATDACGAIAVSRICGGGNDDTLHLRQGALGTITETYNKIREFQTMHLYNFTASQLTNISLGSAGLLEDVRNLILIDSDYNSLTTHSSGSNLTLKFPSASAFEVGKLTGSGGNDTIRITNTNGGTVAVGTVAGNSGNDTIEISDANPARISGGGGIDTIRLAGTVTVTTSDSRITPNITGDSGNNEIELMDGAIVSASELDGGSGGSDWLKVGSGVSFRGTLFDATSIDDAHTRRFEELTLTGASFGTLASPAIITLGTGTGMFNDSASGNRIRFLELLAPTTGFHASITGSADADKIYIAGGTANLVFIDGGAGDDIITLGRGSGGTSTATAINFIGTAPAGCDTLTNGTFRICGGAGNDTLVIDALVTFTGIDVTTDIGSFSTCTDTETATRVSSAQCVGVSGTPPPMVVADADLADVADNMEYMVITGLTTADTRNLTGVTATSVNLLGGNDIMTFTGGTYTGAISGGADNDQLTLNGGSFAAINGDGGDDTITLSGAITTIGAIDGGTDTNGDTLELTETLVYSGTLTATEFETTTITGDIGRSFTNSDLGAVSLIGGANLTLSGTSEATSITYGSGGDNNVDLLGNITVGESIDLGGDANFLGLGVTLRGDHTPNSVIGITAGARCAITGKTVTHAHACTSGIREELRIGNSVTINGGSPFTAIGFKFTTFNGGTHAFTDSDLGAVVFASATNLTLTGINDLSYIMGSTGNDTLIINGGTLNFTGDGITCNSITGIYLCGGGGTTDTLSITGNLVINVKGTALTDIAGLKGITGQWTACTSPSTTVFEADSVTAGACDKAVAAPTPLATAAANDGETYGVIEGMGSADSATLTNIMATDVNLGGGGDIVTFMGGTYTGTISGEGGGDILTFNGGNYNVISGGEDADFIYLQGGSIVASVDPGAGNDTVFLHGSATLGSTINMGPGGDFIELGYDSTSGSPQIPVTLTLAAIPSSGCRAHFCGNVVADTAIDTLTVGNSVTVTGGGAITAKEFEATRFYGGTHSFANSDLGEVIFRAATNLTLTGDNDLASLMGSDGDDTVIINGGTLDFVGTGIDCGGDTVFLCGGGTSDTDTLTITGNLVIRTGATESALTTGAIDTLAKFTAITGQWEACTSPSTTAFEADSVTSGACDKTAVSTTATTGNDTLNITLSSTAITIDALEGNDKIYVSGTGNLTSLNAGPDNDEVRIGIAADGATVATSITIAAGADCASHLSGSKICGGSGNDTLHLAAGALGTLNPSSDTKIRNFGTMHLYNFSGSTHNLGTFVLNSTTTSRMFRDVNHLYLKDSNFRRITGSSGNNTINIDYNLTAGGSLNFGAINTAGGNDTLVINFGANVPNSLSFGGVNIQTGDGNDTIRITGSSPTALPQTSSIIAGNGNDTIELTNIRVNSVGGNADNDTIILSGTVRVANNITTWRGNDIIQLKDNTIYTSGQFIDFFADEGTDRLIVGSGVMVDGVAYNDPTQDSFAGYTSGFEELVMKGAVIGASGEGNGVDITLGTGPGIFADGTYSVAASNNVIRHLELLDSTIYGSITGSAQADKIYIAGGTANLVFIDTGTNNDTIVLGQNSDNETSDTTINFTGNALRACGALRGTFRICGGTGNDTLMITSGVTFTFPEGDITTAVAGFTDCTAHGLTSAECVGVDGPVAKIVQTGTEGYDTLTYDGSQYHSLDALGGNDIINVTGTSDLRYLQAGAGADIVRLGVDADGAAVSGTVITTSGTATCAFRAPEGSKICGGWGRKDEDTLYLAGGALGTINSVTDARIREFEVMHLIDFTGANALGTLTMGRRTGLVKDVRDLFLTDSSFGGITGSAEDNIITLAGAITARAGILGKKGNDTIILTDSTAISTVGTFTIFNGSGQDVVLPSDSPLRATADWLKVGSGVTINTVAFDATNAAAQANTAGFEKLTLDTATIGSAGTSVDIVFGSGVGMFHDDDSGNAIRYLELVDSTLFGSITGTDDDDTIIISGGSATMEFIKTGAGDDVIQLGRILRDSAFELIPNPTIISFDTGTAPISCDGQSGKFRLCGGAGVDSLVIASNVTFTFATGEALETTFGGFANYIPPATPPVISTDGTGTAEDDSIHFNAGSTGTAIDGMAGDDLIYVVGASLSLSTIVAGPQTGDGDDNVYLGIDVDGTNTATILTVTGNAGCGGVSTARICGGSGTDRLAVNGAASIFGSTNLNPLTSTLVSGFEIIELRNFKPATATALEIPTGIEELALVSGRDAVTVGTEITVTIYCIASDSGAEDCRAVRQSPYLVSRQEVVNNEALTGYTNRQDINLGDAGSISVVSGDTASQSIHLIGVNLGTIDSDGGDDTIQIAGRTDINGADTLGVSDVFVSGAVNAGAGDDTVILGGSYGDAYGLPAISNPLDYDNYDTLYRLATPDGADGIFPLLTTISMNARTTTTSTVGTTTTFTTTTLATIDGGAGDDDALVFDGNPLFDLEGGTNYVAVDPATFPARNFETLIMRNADYGILGISVGSGTAETLSGGLDTLSLHNITAHGGIITEADSATIYLSGRTSIGNIILRGTGTNNVYIGTRLDNNGAETDVSTTLNFTSAFPCSLDSANPHARICIVDSSDSTLTIATTVDAITILDTRVRNGDIINLDIAETPAEDAVGVADLRADLPEITIFDADSSGDTIDVGGGSDVVFVSGAGRTLKHIIAGPATEDGDDFVYIGINADGENVDATAIAAPLSDTTYCNGSTTARICGGGGTDRLVINGAASIYGGTNFNPIDNDLVNGFEMIELRNFGDGTNVNLETRPDGLDELALISGRTITTSGPEDVMVTLYCKSSTETGPKNCSETRGERGYHQVTRTYENVLTTTYTNRQDINLGNTGTIIGRGGTDRIRLVGVNVGRIDTHAGGDILQIAGRTDIKSNTARAVRLNTRDDILILGGSYDDAYGYVPVSHRVDGAGGDALETTISLAGPTATIDGGQGNDVIVFDGDPQFDLAGGETYIDPDFSRFPADQFETLIVRGGDYASGIDLSTASGMTSTVRELALHDVTLANAITGSGDDDDLYISGNVQVANINMGAGDDDIIIGKRLENDGTRTTNTPTILNFTGTLRCAANFRICGGTGTNTLTLANTVSAITIGGNNTTLALAATGFTVTGRAQSAPPPPDLQADPGETSPNPDTGLSRGYASGFENLIFEFDLQLDNALIPAMQSITRDLALSAMRQDGVYSGQRQLEGYQAATMKTFLAPDLTADAGYEQNIEVSEHGVRGALWQSEGGTQSLKAGGAMHILNGELSAGEEVYEITGQAGGLYLAYDFYALTVQAYALGAWFNIADTNNGTKTHHTPVAEGTQLLFGGRAAFDVALGGITLTPNASIFWQDTDMDTDYVYLGREETTGAVALDAAWATGSLSAGFAYDDDFAGYEGGTQHYNTEPVAVVGFSQALPSAGAMEFRVEADWRRGLDTNRESGNVRLTGALAF